MAVTPQSLPRTVASDRVFVDSIDPATNEVIARFQAARWTMSRNFRTRPSCPKRMGRSFTSPPLCGVLRLRDAIYSRRDDIATIISRETGKPRVEAIFAEVLLALDTVDFLARQAPGWLRRSVFRITILR